MSNRNNPLTPAEISAMREGGTILAGILADVRARVVPGVTEREINDYVAAEITARGAHATYGDPDIDFPGVICISTNDAVVHGVPTNRAFKAGDVVGFDLVIEYRGMKTDAAFSMCVGEADNPDIARLLQGTEESLHAAIGMMQGRSPKVQLTVGDIGAAVQGVLQSYGLGIIRDLVGHGVGREMHMPPDVPNFGRVGKGEKLYPGDTIAIEPMATLAGEGVYVDGEDGWTIKTADGSLAAHFEHTVLITEDGAEILTSL